MKAVGIVSEYNPFHLGHAHHIEKTLEALGGGDDRAVVCCMSGNFVQRGDFAAFEKSVRAECAVFPEGARERGLFGADLVIELPPRCALSSAEGFARGAVRALSSLGCVDALSFGSESGDMSVLQAVADALEDVRFPVLLSAELKKGVSFPRAREGALSALIGELARIISGPNNILAVEYLRALRREGPEIMPLTVPRTGAGHDLPLEPGRFASASAIRELILSGRLSEARAFLPERTFEILSREMSLWRAPASLASADRAVMCALRRLSPEDFKAVRDCSEGLHNRLFEAVRRARSFAEAADIAKTKRYTHSRIRRVLLRAFLGMYGSGDEPRYISVLALNARGRRLLSEAEPELPLITKPSHSKKLPPPAAGAFLEAAKFDDLFSFGLPGELRPGGAEYRRSPVYVE